MFPSILFIPASGAFWSVVRLLSGPQRAIRMAQIVSHGVARIMPSRDRLIHAGEMAFELRLLQRMQWKPWVACLETACAFSVWLACHGQRSTIKLGKRVENGMIMMHAWVESYGEKFFYDARFEPVFEKAAAYCASAQ